MRAIRALLPGILVLALFVDGAGCLHAADLADDRPRAPDCAKKSGRKSAKQSPAKSPAGNQLQPAPARPAGSQAAPQGTGRAAKAGPRDARFITDAKGNTVDLRVFQGLTRNPGTVSAGRSGAGRPLTGPANSYSLTDGGHALVYGPEGRLLYDVSTTRIKAFQWHQAPSGQWFSNTDKDLKFTEVPRAILDALGL